ncbi:MAG: hypothetical protein JSV51_10085 [Candidatus Bathyarchaeota archaeon]|nr:MAG: hypothetical protein JSV51_10085 [Candidatus Bathyarchaeota archaeon]
MKEKWIIPGIIFLAIGLLAFFTSSEIQVEVGMLPFTFALVTMFVAGLIFLVAGVTAYITNRL